MKKIINGLQGLVLCAALLPLQAMAAESADKYPTKPIRIMGQGTGSTADYLSRYIGQRLTERWGQPVVVDNRAGAGGTIPTDVVAKAAPDGYSLVMGHVGPLVSAVSLYKNLPYDPLKDLAPITRTATLVTVVVVHPSVPVASAKELIAHARQKGGMTYGSAGNGSISHLTGELMKNVTGLQLQHVPYKSAGAALTAVLSGEVPLSFLSPVTAYAQLKAGKVKALAVSSKDRFAGTPDIPSATEAGLAGVEAELWFGLLATAGTPKPIIAKLNREIVGILNSAEVKKGLLERGAITTPSTPEELTEWIRSELKKWTPIIKASGIVAG